MVIEALINSFLVEIHRDNITEKKYQAEAVCDFIYDNVKYINEEISKDFNVKLENCEFLNDYLKSLDSLKLFILSNSNNLNDITEILKSELFYIYKNIQLYYVKKNNLEVELVSGSNACEICQFLKTGKYDLTNHFLNDSCESYLRLKPVLNSFVNIIHPISNLYRVPVKYRRSIESFLNTLVVKDIKTNKKQIYYFISPEEYDLKDDILYVQKDAKIYLRFRHMTFKEDLLRCILSVTESEESRNLFYTLLKQNDNGNINLFINFLAKQNSLDFLKESMIAYILTPDILRECSEETYQFIGSVII
jgi:hypothetical protein